MVENKQHQGDSWLGACQVAPIDDKPGRTENLVNYRGWKCFVNYIWEPNSEDKVVVNGPELMSERRVALAPQNRRRFCNFLEILQSRGDSNSDDKGPEARKSAQGDGPCGARASIGVAGRGLPQWCEASRVLRRPLQEGDYPAAHPELLTIAETTVRSKSAGCRESGVQ